MKPAFLDEMDRALAVRQHVILHFNTQDRFYWPEGEIKPCNLNYFLALYFRRQGYRTAQYIPAIGVCELSHDDQEHNSNSRLNQLKNVREPIQILNGLFDLLRQQVERWIVLIQYGEHIAPQPNAPSACGEQDEVQAAEILHQIALDDEIAMGHSRVVLITFEGMPTDLLGRSPAYRPISVGLPTREEREAFINFLEGLRNGGRHEFGELDEDLVPEEFTRITSGMPLGEIESLYRASGHFHRPVSRTEVRETKARAIRQLARDLLQVSEPQAGFKQVAGLATIKEYFGKLLIPQIRAGLPAPQAILFHGVPGCGKSHVVQAVACELGWPLLEMRNIRGRYVGQSEQQLELMIAVVEQLSPCVLFFDEIDQLLGQRGTGNSGDSGTSERLLARIFNWLGSMHLRGRVIFVGASNRPDLLDPALLDRFRVSIPILKPTKSEIQELIPILLARFDRKLSGEVDLGMTASFLASLKPSGRSLQEILIQAGLRADAESGQLGGALSERYLEAAAKDHLSAEDPVELEFIRLASLNLCSAHSLLPWNGINGMCPDAEIPNDLLEIGIVGSDGRLNLPKLNEHLRRLAQDRQMARAMR
jgi:transitional endoplasmic reticulum ATPase